MTLEEAQKEVKEFTNTPQYESFLLQNLEKYEIKPNERLRLEASDVR